MNQKDLQETTERTQLPQHPISSSQILACNCSKFFQLNKRKKSHLLELKTKVFMKFNDSIAI